MRQRSGGGKFNRSTGLAVFRKTLFFCYSSFRHDLELRPHALFRCLSMTSRFGTGRNVPLRTIGQLRNYRVGPTW